MNPPSDTSPHYEADAQAVAYAPMAETRPMYWSVRRELWENRSIYLAPLIVAAVVLFASMVNTIALPKKVENLRALEPARQHAVLVKPFSMAPAPIMFTTFLVALFYCLEAFYGERRDRSILFWKSLPVSDRTTMAAKLSIPFTVLPLLGFVLSVVVQVILLFVSTTVLLGYGLSPGALWGELRFFEGLLIMLYGLTVHVLWFAPIYGWFFLMSAWARRAPFLWAVVPFMAIAAVERIVSNSSPFLELLRYRATGAMAEAFVMRGKGAAEGNFDRLSQLDPARFLSTPGLWAGLVFAAICLAAVVRLRRNREPI